MANRDNKIPWNSLRYLIGEVIYGGRVTDDYDRRVLMTYLDEYMGDFLFDTFQLFHFHKNTLVDYRLPPGGARENYIQEIEAYPLTNAPDVFGLHPDAEINYLTSATKDLWLQLINLQPRTGDGAGGISREEFITNIATDIQNRLPAPFDVLRIRKTIGTPSPTQIVLLQELDRWNLLVNAMASSLKDLQKALKGEIGMSQELDDLSYSLFNGMVCDGA